MKTKCNVTTQKIVKGAFFGCLLALQVSNSWAVQLGGDNSGGGLGVSGMTLDSYEARSQVHFQEISPSSLASYKKYIEPILTNLHKKLPEFANEIRASLIDKKWYLSRNKLARTNDECTIFEFDLEQIARQDDKSVYLYSEWFIKAENNDPEEQAKLVFHEMLMHTFLKGKTSYSCSTQVREMNRLLWDIKSKSSTEIQKAAWDLSFGSYSTHYELSELVFVIDTSYQKLCKGEFVINSKDPFAIQDAVIQQFSKMQFGSPAYNFYFRVSDYLDAAYYGVGSVTKAKVALQKACSDFENWKAQLL